MSTQKEIFLSDEADAWFQRNKNAVSSKDLNGTSRIITDTLNLLEIKPVDILEIGCSNGYNLNFLHKEFGAKCCGIDPSAEAVNTGREEFSDLDIKVGTAENLEYATDSFDLIIFGFCLYLCDRGDLFRIACEADRCLRDNGYLVLIDFYPNSPFKNKYVHCSDVYSYKMRYAGMFLWNPEY